MLIAIIGGVFGLFSGFFSGHDDTNKADPKPSISTVEPQPKGSPTQATCGEGSGYDVDLRPHRELDVDTDGTLNALVGCQLRPGDHLVWMVQIDGVSSPPHSNYYQKGELGSAGSYSYDVHLGNAEHGSIRKTYVVLADDEAYREMIDGADPEGVLLKLPDGVRRVSNPVTVKRW
ncbi:hypothetical protein ACFWIJ_02195 [Streptomyces sp. NPDC127079]|uniref:DUF2771 domain-containing protein n=1 Tax=Streptomyces sp. R39 TaxID=3238631 RepID=A0AB39QH63_9ACTN